MLSLDQNYWNNRYLQGQTGWDIGAASTPLKGYIDQLIDRQQRILIPGGGNSYEAAYLMENGFADVTVLDIAPALITSLETRFAHWLDKGLHLICENFFDHQVRYDLVLEQTFFCALDPSLRRDYVQHMHRLLLPGGVLAGVLFDTDFPGRQGPPFGGSLSEYRDLFAPFFEIRHLAPCYNSIPPRQGSEVFIEFVKP